MPSENPARSWSTVADASVPENSASAVPGRLARGPPRSTRPSAAVVARRATPVLIRIVVLSLSICAARGWPVAQPARAASTIADDTASSGSWAARAVESAPAQVFHPVCDCAAEAGGAFAGPW